MAEAAKREKKCKKLSIVQARNPEKPGAKEIKTLNRQVNLPSPVNIKKTDVELPKASVNDPEIKQNSDPIYKNKNTSRMKKLGGNKVNLTVRSVTKRPIIDPVLDKKGTTDKKYSQKSIDVTDIVYVAAAVSEVYKHFSSSQREPSENTNTNQNDGLGDKDKVDDNEVDDDEEDGKDEEAEECEEVDEDEDESEEREDESEDESEECEDESEDESEEDEN